MNLDVVKEKILIKYSAPSKFCSEPYGQIWKQMHDDNLSTLYIQTSKNDQEPNWMRMADFLEKAFGPQVAEESFISGCLELLEQNQ